MAANLRKLSSISKSIFACSEFVRCRGISQQALNLRKNASGTEKTSGRKKLIDDFKKGNFADIKEYQRTGGKRFMAPTSLIEKKKALQFPAIVANSLSGNCVDLMKAFSGNTTLVLIAMRGIAQPMCDAYREPYCDFFKDEKKAKCFEVNAVDSSFYGMFKGFINRSLAKQIPVERHDNYLCYYGSTAGIRSEGFVENVVVGHAFLIDSNGLVRWRACAKPTNEEIESLIACSQRMLKYH